MFIDYETNNGRAQLQSNLYPANPGFYKCISFWYYMNGIYTGTLTVLQLIDGQQEALWSLTGDQNQNWLFGQVPMSADQDFRVSVLRKFSSSSYQVFYFSSEFGGDNIF